MLRWIDRQTQGGRNLELQWCILYQRRLVMTLTRIVVIEGAAHE